MSIQPRRRLRMQGETGEKGKTRLFICYVLQQSLAIVSFQKTGCATFPFFTFHILDLSKRGKRQVDRAELCAPTTHLCAAALAINQYPCSKWQEQNFPLNMHLVCQVAQQIVTAKSCHISSSV